MAGTRLIIALTIFGVSSVWSASEKCIVPPSSGSSCDPTNSSSGSNGTTTRFYYSAVNYNCAEFPYSGCGGNENNFLTLEDCKAQCGASGSAIDINKIQSALNNTKCWYKDKLYGIGEKIEATVKDNACSVGCLCALSGAGEPRITCAAIDCPPPPVNKQHCAPIYKDNSCCPTTYKCSKPENNSTGNATDIFKCKYLDREYVDGESIYPDDYPCYKCTCSRNFTGDITTDVCQEVNCGIAIHHQLELANQCEPEYYKTAQGKTLCCPIQWNCKQQVVLEEEEEE